MRERRFVIYEDDESGYNSCHIRAITETELLKRLALCIYSQDRIATLLNGTELQPEPIILSRAEPVSVDNPTRKEWEMFAHNLANAIYFRADESTLTKRILSMPIVPKEERDE